MDCCTTANGSVLRFVAYHKLQIFVRMRLMGSKAPIEVQPLSEEKAVEMGSELLGELILFSVGVGYISYEYFRSVQKGKHKEDSQDNLIAKLNDRVNDMETQLKTIKTELEKSKLEKDSKSPQNQRKKS